MVLLCAIRHIIKVGVMSQISMIKYGVDADVIFEDPN